MAMQTYVFIETDSLPEKKELQEAIIDNGFKYKLPENFDIKTASVVYGAFETLASYFDYELETYSSDDWNWTPEEVDNFKNTKYVAIFNAYSNAQEITGMLIVASSLAQLTSALTLSDFFTDDLIASNEVVDFAKQIVENSRSQFSGPSTTRQAIEGADNLH